MNITLPPKLVLLLERLRRKDGSSSEAQYLGPVEQGAGHLRATPEDSIDPSLLNFGTGIFKDPRPQAKALRIAVFVIVILLMVVVVLADALSSLTPLRRDVPMLLETRPWDRAVVEARPLRSGGDRTDELLRHQIARYVRVRYEVVPDLAEMDRRWGTSCFKANKTYGWTENDELCSFIFLRSHSRVFGRFVEEIRPVKTFIQAGKSRLVRILNDPTRLDVYGEQSQWEVRFEVIDYKRPDSADLRAPSAEDRIPGAPVPIRTSRWRAKIWIHLNGPEKRADTKKVTDEMSEENLKRLRLNPTGFMVTKFEPAEEVEDNGTEGKND